MKIKISIRRGLFFILILTVFLSILSISLLWTCSVIDRSNAEAEHVRHYSVIEQKRVIKNKVNEVIELINFTRKVETNLPVEEIQSQILDYCSNIRFANGGYIFINSLDGDALLFDGIRIVGHKSISKLEDSDGFKIFDAEIAAYNKPDGDFIKYKFKKISEDSQSLKLSYIKGYKDWKWIIGAGVYMSDIEPIIKKGEEEYLNILKRELLHILLIFLSFVIILVVVSILISKFIGREFEVFESFLERSSNDLFKIDINSLSVMEFKQLAKTTNIVIEKQRRVEQQLEYEVDKARSYLDIASVIILVLDTEGNVVLINKKGSEIIGASIADIVGKNWFRTFIPIADKKVVMQNYKDVIEANGKKHFKNVDSKIVTVNGDYRVISWKNSLLFDKSGNISGILSSGNDITEKRNIEKSFSESEKKYKLLFEKSNDPVLVIGADNTFVDLNTAALKILKVTSKREIVGTHPDKISPEKQLDGSYSIVKASEMISMAHKNGFHRFDWVHVDSEGSYVYVDVSLTLIPIDGVDYIYVVWKDISDKRKLIEELVIAKEKAEESEKLKTNFLHNMQHEVRTPLNAMMGFAQLLKTNVSENIVNNQYCDTILRSGNNLKEIINDIIDFSTLQSGSFTLVNENIHLNQLIIEVYKHNLEKQTNSHITFTFETCVSNHNATVMIDAGRVQQILNNLLDNAFKFTEKGSVTFGYNLSEDNILFYVKDTGIGIPDSIKESIFSKFSDISYDDPSKLYGGTGIGLSIAKSILGYLDGEIWVESQFKEGSEFYFTIPNHPVSIDYKAVSRSFKGKNIGVVSSSTSLQDLIKNSFKDIDTTINILLNGNEAVSFCQNNYKFDIIIVDGNLTGMKTITTIKALRAFNKDMLLFVICEDKKETMCREDSIKAGCNGVLYDYSSPDEVLICLAVNMYPDILASAQPKV